MSAGVVPDPGAYEVVVVGAGAAGLAAAAVLGRSSRRVLVVGGRDRANVSAPEVHNLPYAEGIPPGRLYEAMEGELTRLGVRVARVQVQSVAADAGAAGCTVTFAADGAGTTVGTADGAGTSVGTSVGAARLVLATGARHELPEWVPDGTWGTSVFDCPFCHAREHAGEDFATVGKGLAAIETALLCVGQFRSMTVLVTDPAAATGPAAARLRENGGEVLLGSVERAVSRPGGLELHTSAGRPVNAGAVLLTGTLRPRTAFFDQLGLRMVLYGIPELDDDGRSSHPSVWVAGMAARPFYMLAESIAGGVRAGVSVHKDLALAGLPASP